MARRRRRRARRQARKGKSPLKIVGIVVLLSLPVLYFFFTQFVFDPFEGSIGRFDQLVPREVDVYVRREKLSSDFQVFPMPRELSRLVMSPRFREVADSDWYAEQPWITELSGLGERLDEALADAPFDPLADLLGEEVVVLARLPDGVGEARYAYLARLSDKGRIAYGLMERESVREQALPGAELREIDDPEYPNVTYRRVDLPDGTTWFFARELDMLVVSSDEPLVRDVMRTALVEQEQSLGLTRMYAENLPPAVAPPDNHFSAELFVDVPAYLAAREADEDLGERSANAATNVLRQIVDLTLWRDMIARLDVDGGRVVLDAYAALDSQAAQAADTGIVGQSSFRVGEQLGRELGRVPRSVVAAVTAKVDVADLLRTVFQSFSADIKTLVNDALREMSRLNPGWNRAGDAQQLIDLLEVVLRDEITLVARPIDHELPADVQPVPALALIAPIGNLEAWRGLERAFQTGMRAFGLGVDGLNNWTINEGIGERVWFETAGLPFTELAYIVIEDELLVIATDNDLVKEIIEVFAAAEPSLASKPDVDELIRASGDERANLAVWVDARGLRDVLEPYATWVAEDATRIDFGIRRVQARRELIDREYPQYRGRDDDLPGSIEAELDRKLDEQLAAEEAQRKAEVVPAMAAEWLDGLAWIGALQRVFVALDLGERQATAKVVVDTVAAP